MTRKLCLGLASTWAEGLLLRTDLWVLREFYARTGLRMLPCVLYRTAIVVVNRLMTYSMCGAKDSDFPRWIAALGGRAMQVRSFAMAR